MDVDNTISLFYRLLNMDLIQKNRLLSEISKSRGKNIIGSTACSS